MGSRALLALALVSSVAAVLSTNLFSGSMTTCSIDSGFHGAGESGDGNARWWVDVNGDGLADFCRVVGYDGSSPKTCMTCSLTAVPVARITVEAEGKTVPLQLTGKESEFAVEELLRRSIGIDGDFHLTTPNGSHVAIHASLPDGRYKAAIAPPRPLSGLPGVFEDEQWETCGLDGGFHSVDPPGDGNARWWVDVNGDGLADFCRLTGVNSGSAACILCSITKFPPPDASEDSVTSKLAKHGVDKSNMLFVSEADLDRIGLAVGEKATFRRIQNAARQRPGSDVTP